MGQDPANTPVPTDNAPVRAEAKHLPNALWVQRGVLSGGLPEGDAAFEELQQLGIRTVISVDGIPPDTARADKYGLRYIHLPHGYDGIPKKRILEIAKAIQCLPGPVYIHCHHGKHRSPAAASAACVSLGLITPQQALTVLKIAGTNPGFRGLFDAIETSRGIQGEEISTLDVEYRSRAEVTPMVDAMVSLDALLDRLEKHQNQLWESPEIAASDSLLLKEHYMELHRSESHAGSRPEAFLNFLVEGQELSTKLESVLLEHHARSREERTAVADGVLKALSQNCVQCHVAFRDSASP